MVACCFNWIRLLCGCGIFVLLLAMPAPLQAQTAAPATEEDRPAARASCPILRSRPGLQIRTRRTTPPTPPASNDVPTLSDILRSIRGHIRVDPRGRAAIAAQFERMWIILNLEFQVNRGGFDARTGVHHGRLRTGVAGAPVSQALSRHYAFGTALDTSRPRQGTRPAAALRGDHDRLVRGRQCRRVPAFRLAAAAQGDRARLSARIPGRAPRAGDRPCASWRPAAGTTTTSSASASSR